MDRESLKGLILGALVPKKYNNMAEDIITQIIDEQENDEKIIDTVKKFCETVKMANDVRSLYE